MLSITSQILMLSDVRDGSLVGNSVDGDWSGIVFPELRVLDIKFITKINVRGSDYTEETHL